MKKLQDVGTKQSAAIVGVCFAAILGTGAGASAAPRGPDFDNDGNDDLMVGVNESSMTVDDYGALNFLYGSDGSGLEEPVGFRFYLDQDVTGVINDPHDGDELAEAGGLGHANSLAWGDFDGDCYDDVAVGVPGEEVGGDAAAGGVHVFYSGSLGPSTTDEIWTRDDGIVAETADADDRLGTAIIVADFDGDFYADLAIGVPNDDSGAAGAGSVTVLYGSSGGLTDSGSLFIRQGNSGFEGTAEAGDNFGQALAAGDFDCDGYDDLAIGVPGEDTNEGAVQIVYGSNAGLGNTGDFVFQQGGDAQGSPTEGDKFGLVLTTGNFNADTDEGFGCDDLAVGTPMEDASELLTDT